MSYNTTPITSGAAKFSTLDPDGSLFLQEQDITRGPDPENPIKFYNQQTGELNAVNSIITSEEELNINSSDLIGVKRFICQDYLGAIKATASDNQQDSVSIDSIVTVHAGTHVYSTKLFRIPSNIISGSSIRIKYTAATNVSKTVTSGLYLYDPDTDTRTEINSHTTPGSTSETVSLDITVNAGELYGLYAYAESNYGRAYGNINLNYDFDVYSGAVWDVITL